MKSIIQTPIFFVFKLRVIPVINAYFTDGLFRGRLRWQPNYSCREKDGYH